MIVNLVSWVAVPGVVLGSVHIYIGILSLIAAWFGQRLHIPSVTVLPLIDY